VIHGESPLSCIWASRAAVGTADDIGFGSCRRPPPISASDASAFLLLVISLRVLLAKWGPPAVTTQSRCRERPPAGGCATRRRWLRESESWLSASVKHVTVSQSESRQPLWVPSSYSQCSDGAAWQRIGDKLLIGAVTSELCASFTSSAIDMVNGIAHVSTSDGKIATLSGIFNATPGSWQTAAPVPASATSAKAYVRDLAVADDGMTYAATSMSLWKYCPASASWVGFDAACTAP
jgi:hypothetical protein